MEKKNIIKPYGYVILYYKSNLVYSDFCSQFLIFQKNNIVLRRQENEHGHLGTIIFLKN